MCDTRNSTCREAFTDSANFSDPAIGELFPDFTLPDQHGSPSRGRSHSETGQKKPRSSLSGAGFRFTESMEIG